MVLEELSLTRLALANSLVSWVRPRRGPNGLCLQALCLATFVEMALQEI